MLSRRAPPRARAADRPQRASLARAPRRSPRCEPTRFADPAPPASPAPAPPVVVGHGSLRQSRLDAQCLGHWWRFRRHLRGESRQHGTQLGERHLAGRRHRGQSARRHLREGRVVRRLHDGGPAATMLGEEIVPVWRRHVDSPVLERRAVFGNGSGERPAPSEELFRRWVKYRPSPTGGPPHGSTPRLHSGFPMASIGAAGPRRLPRSPASECRSSRRRVAEASA